MADRVKDQRLVINVGGVRHHTYASTLEKLPGTRLAILAKLREQDESYDSAEDEYFFDRHPAAFLDILELYREDELHITDTICGNAMKKELDFWGIFESDIEACCWGNYAKFLDHRETLANLDSSFGTAHIDKDDDLSKLSAWKRFQTKVWINLEYPSVSRGAKAMTLVSTFFVMASILEFVMETHYWFRVVRYENDTMGAAPNPEEYYSTGSCACCQSFIHQDYPTTVAHPYLQYADYCCLAFFCLEFTVRVIFCPDKCAFVKGLLNIIDFICIVPQILAVIITQQEMGAASNRASAILKGITILRIVRILRIFKLMKHYSAFKILAYTIKVSTRELLLMVVFLMTGVMIFASIIHYAEEKNFTSIPIGFWWAIVTMTTVGYGDKVPLNTAGYAIGSFCAIAGVLVIAFTVPIVVNNFTLYYSHAQSRIKVPMKLKRRSKRPGMVDVKPSKRQNHKAYTRHDCETPVTVGTLDNNMNVSSDFNFNIQKVDSTPKRSNIQSKAVNETKMFSSLEYTGRLPNMQQLDHRRQARELVDNMAERNQQQMNERRRQYMLAFRRMEERKHGIADEQHNQDGKSHA